MRAVIVNWIDTFDLSDISVVLKADGTPQIFDSTWEARNYAMNNLNGRSEVITVDHETV